MSTTLVLADQSAALDGSYQALVQLLTLNNHNQAVQMQMLDRLLEGATELSSDYYSHIALLLPTSAVTASLLTTLLAALSAGGVLDVRGVTAPEQRATLAAQLTASGLASVRQEGEIITSSKPAALSVPLSFKRAGATTSSALPLRTSRAAKASLWAFTAPAAGASTPTIDESTLLTAADLERPTLIKREDCDVKRTRKACKDCSCGLRELLLDEDEQDDLVAAGFAEAKPSGIKTGAKRMKSTVTSSCGNCYLGDAFRCGGCPYLGMPAFEPGQKVTIGADMDDL